MAFEDDWEQDFPHTVTIHPYTGEDVGGKPTYGTPVPVAAFIRDEMKRWRWEDGTEIQSKRMVYFSREAVTVRDKFVFPAGFIPQTCTPLWLIRRDDEEGYHHHEAYV